MPKKPEVSAEELLDRAILCVAQSVNNNLDEIVAALRRDRQDELADELVKLHGRWRDASQDAFDAMQQQVKVMAPVFALPKFGHDYIR